MTHSFISFDLNNISSFQNERFSNESRSPVTICLQYLSTKGEILHLHGRLSGFVKKIKIWIVNKLIEIEKLRRYRWSQFVSNNWHRNGNLIGDKGSNLTISVSRKIRTTFINFRPLFLKKILNSLRWFFF